MEHVGEATIFLADAIAHRSRLAVDGKLSVAKAQDAVGRRPVAHLVIEPDQRDVVALRRISIPHDVLGYDEQRQSAHAMFGRTRPGQHEMHDRSEEHTSELQSLMRISYAVFCLKKQKKKNKQ